MKTFFSGKFTFNIPALLAVGCLLFFASLRQPETKDPDPAARNCCKGYTIPMNQLRKFMLDSLATNQFEGGVYSKADLLAALNSLAGDSVYVMNAVINCLLNQGNGMFITSRQTGEVKIISKNPYCAPCPGRACCPQRICAAAINRACLSYQRYGFAPEIALSEE